MVIDLTNSSKYYSFDESAGTSEFQYPGNDSPSIFYRKVKLIGLDGQKASQLTHICGTYTSKLAAYHCRSVVRGMVKPHNQMLWTTSAGAYVPSITCNSKAQSRHYGPLSIAPMASIAQVLHVCTMACSECICHFWELNMQILQFAYAHKVNKGAGRLAMLTSLPNDCAWWYTALRLWVLAAGYMIANALVRLQGRTAMGAVKVFAECRPPGIYKRHYIEEIFRYNHELL